MSSEWAAALLDSSFFGNHSPAHNLEEITASITTPKSVQTEDSIDRNVLPRARLNVVPPPPPVELEEIVDEEFLLGAHPSNPKAKFWLPWNIERSEIPILFIDRLIKHGVPPKDWLEWWDDGEQIYMRRKARSSISQYQLFSEDEEDSNQYASEEECERVEEWQQGTTNNFVRKWQADISRCISSPTKSDFVSDESKPLRLEDFMGRQFDFPFNMVSSWEGILKCINEKFEGIAGFGQLVSEGFYDLTSPNGLSIESKDWSRLVEPGWEVTMSLWPIAEISAHMRKVATMNTESAGSYAGSEDAYADQILPGPQSMRQPTPSSTPPQSPRKSIHQFSPFCSPLGPNRSNQKENMSPGVKSNDREAPKLPPAKKRWFSGLRCASSRRGVKKAGSTRNCV